MTTLNEIVNLVPEGRRAVAKNLVVELNFMKRTLVQLRKYVDEHGAVDLFCNGKQQMLRESPALKSYSTLINRYGSIYKQLVSMIPEDQQPEEDEFDRFLAGEY